MAQRAVTLQKRLFGATHPEVGLGLANLAVMQQSIGQMNEAALSYRDALAILEPTLGSSHPTTMTCRINFQALGAPPE